MSEPIIQLRPEGLYCARGDFYIDPWRPVARAVITHGHADHARSGSGVYHASRAGLSLLNHRLGATALVHPHAYGEQFVLGDACVSLHPAGHILGSAQVRVEVDGEVWVVTGDYKREADPTCAAFTPIPCDTLITEATFALPCYRWEPMERTVSALLAWWEQCARERVPAVLYAYALGKAQRLLAELALRAQRPVYLHGAMVPLVELYRAEGIALPDTPAVSEQARSREYAGELILAPPSAAGSPWMKRFAGASTAFASGWMLIRGNRRRRGYDRGFAVSDHADWPALIRSIRESGARRVWATHGSTEALVAWLREQGIDAQALRTELGGEH